MLEHLIEASATSSRDRPRPVAQTSSRIFIEGGGEIVRRHRPARQGPAARETFAVFDETHLYVLPELRQMHKDGPPQPDQA